jgi:hypothetical protein
LSAIHLPRHCGIATFTTHLADALAAELPDVDSFVLAMNDAGRRHTYPSRVRFEIAEGDLGSYRRAADFLNVNQGDVGYVTFPCGYTLGPDGDAVNLYYGAADTAVAMATGSVSQLLDWLDRHGTAA